MVLLKNTSLLHQFINKKEGVISEIKVKASFADKDLSSWTGLGRSGHVQIPTFGQISRASGPKPTFWGDFIGILKRISARNLKKTVFPTKKRKPALLTRTCPPGLALAGPDISKFRLLLPFRTFPVQNWFFEVIS